MPKIMKFHCFLCETLQLVKADTLETYSLTCNNIKLTPSGEQSHASKFFVDVGKGMEKKRKNNTELGECVKKYVGLTSGLPLVQML